MTHTGRIAAAVAVVAFLHLACQPSADIDAAGDSGSPHALSLQAKLTLAQLEPALERPTNPPGIDQLPERAEPIVVQAEALLARRNFIRAIQLLERARGFAPDSPRVFKDLGLAYDLLGDFAKARANMEASLTRAPDDIVLNLKLAQYATRSREYDRAILLLRRGLVCSGAADGSPDTAESILRLARLLEARGYFTASLECYQRLSDLLLAHGRAYAGRAALKSLVDGPEQTLVDQGKVLLKLRRLPEAAKALERAYRRNKTHPQAGLLAVKSLLALKQFDRAQAIVMEMLTNPVQRGLAVELATELCQARKDAAVAKRLLRAYLDRGGKDMTFVLAMAEVVADLGDTEAAAEILTSHLKSSPTDHRAALRLVGLYARTGDLAAAADQLAALLAAGSMESSQLRQEVKLLARQGVTRKLVEEMASAAEKGDRRVRPAALCVVGLLAEVLGRRTLAVDLLRRSIQEGVRFWPSYEILADVYLARGDLDALEGLGKRVEKVAADDYFEHYFLGKIALERGRIGEAVSSLMQARARRGSDVPTLLLLARALISQRKFPDAEEHLTIALNLAPDDGAVVGELVEVYIVRRRLAEASRTVAGFLQRNRSSVVARSLAVRVLFESKQLSRAKAELQALLTEEPNDVGVRMLEVRFDLPRSLKGDPIQAAKAKAALKRIDRILQLDEGNLPAQMLKASLLANQKNFSQAIDVWEGVLDRKLQDYEVVRRYLGALVAAGRTQQVSAAVRRVVQAGPVAVAVRLMLLEKLLEAEDFTLAEELVERWLGEYAQQDQPVQAERFMFRRRALEVYEKAGRFEKAHRLLDRWIASGVEEGILALLRRDKLRMYGLAKDFDGAIRYSEKWIRNDPESIRPMSGLIYVLLEGEAFEEAHTVLDRWIGKESKGARLNAFRDWKLTVFARQKKFDGLLAYGKKWIAEAPGDVTANQIVIVKLTEHEKHAQALAVAEAWLAHLNKMAATAPATTPADGGRDKTAEVAKVNIVEVLLDAGKLRKALARAREFAADEPDNPRILQLVRRSLALMDKEAEALVVLEKIYELDPDNAMINNDLGYTWADMGIKLDEAEVMIRKALTAEPGSIAVMDSFAWVLYKKAEFDKAKIVFDRIITAAEDLHPVILDHAGDVNWRLGRKDEAIRLWRRALETAKKADKPGPDDRKVLARTPRKIADAERGRAPKVAPLGKGVEADK